MKGAGRLEGGVQAVHASGAEVHHRPPVRRRHRARRLGGEHRLHGDLVHDQGFDELGLGQRRLHLQDGFVGEHRGALGDGMDVAGEVEVPQPVKKALGKFTQGGQITDIVYSEAQVFQVLEDGIEAAGQQEVAARGKAAHEQAEYGRIQHAFLVIGLEHGQFVEIGEQRQVLLSRLLVLPVSHESVLITFAVFAL